MSNTELTNEEIQRLNEEAFAEEMERQLNEEIFAEEQEQALHCSHRSHMSHYVCDGCSIIDACYSIPDEH